MIDYTIKFIGRNAYLSDGENNGECIVSMDFHSVLASQRNGTGVEIEKSNPLIVATTERTVKILAEDKLHISIG